MLLAMPQYTRPPLPPPPPSPQADPLQKYHVLKGFFKLLDKAHFTVYRAAPSALVGLLIKRYFSSH